MRFVGFENISVFGDLKYRAQLSLGRLAGDDYSVKAMQRNGGNSWPGDFEGRILLALTLEAQATGTFPLRLKELLAAFSGLRNEKGYFGKILPESELDEQQLAGNSWFLRALCELYLWLGDESYRGMIEAVCCNLFLPALGKFKYYPCKLLSKDSGGGVYGNLTGETVNNWHLSSDTGCAFIALDGISQACQILQEGRLKQLAVEMAEMFLSVDVVGLSFQTHATLTAVRGLLRLYETDGNTKWMDGARRIFHLYCTQGMTENYENYNWFGRPSWTEPCAVIDSFIIASWLFRLTSDTEYLNLAHNIWYNGISFEQRYNGGFGCNSCLGANSVLLAPSDIFEASWCCTMRGGEGIAEAISLVACEQNDCLIVPFYSDADLNPVFSKEKMQIRMKTSYPVSGEVSLEFLSCPDCIGKLKLFLPDWADASTVTIQVNGQTVPFAIENGFAVPSVTLRQFDRIELFFGITLRCVRTHNMFSNKDLFTYRHGPLILGSHCEDDHVKSVAGDIAYIGNGQYYCENIGLQLYPLANHIHLSYESEKQDIRQVLFARDKS